MTSLETQGAAIEADCYHELVAEPVDDTTSILDGWTDAHSEAFQSEILTFRHRLEETGKFTDEALIDLLDRHPVHMLDVCTMGGSDDPLYPKRFRTGDFRDATSADLLATAKAGKVWINVRNAMTVHEDYKKILDQMYGDLSKVTGNRTYNAKGSILISSPVACVPYHFDKQHVVLWHIRGEKTVHAWPVNQMFIPDTAHQATITNAIDDDLPYSEAFEEHAQVLALNPGDGATWPLNAPHRVDNNTFCVSVTTEYSTPESATKSANMITNSVLRRYLGVNSLYECDSPITRQAKFLAGRVLRKTPLVKDTTHADMVTFKVDPTVEGYLADVEPFERNF